jgi:large subunit ribosomal protein L19
MEKIHSENLVKGLPRFRPGDTLRVFCKIREGDKERLQVFEGVCIKRHRGSIESSFTVRKTSYGVGVERVFPLHSPQIDHIEILNAGRVRRSRLYYLRDLYGKAARIERRAWEAELLSSEEQGADATKADEKADKAAK